ncbi:hypothetical protein [Pedobacter deserti]|uniref:hypothetical protein n=1 Tax=Pedobacter deserti TaxID=2817382 RepID=UPI00210EA37A|nr:hypothetical protein [Pedobacter sp. SYSU D00382]
MNRLTLTLLGLFCFIYQAKSQQPGRQPGNLIKSDYNALDSVERKSVLEYLKVKIKSDDDYKKMISHQDSMALFFRGKTRETVDTAKIKKQAALFTFYFSRLSLQYPILTTMDKGMRNRLLRP